MSRFTFGKKGRRAAALGATGLGACALLAACAPVQAGSAAIVGSQRITVSSVDTQVSNLQAAVKHYGSSTIPSSAPGAQVTQQPTAVLSWMIRFAVMDHLAAEKGITVSQAQQDKALSSLNSVAQQDGAANGTVLLLANGVPPQLFPRLRPLVRPGHGLRHAGERRQGAEHPGGAGQDQPGAVHCGGTAEHPGQPAVRPG